MKHKFFISMSFLLTVIFFACSKENSSVSQKEMLPEEKTSTSNSTGATQISGIGYYATAAECDSESQGADFALTMTGDLDGCLYVFVDEFECSPSGTYREVGREKFVGTYNGQSGEFWTTYRFEAKYEGCNEDGSFEGLEILGRCQHPIAAGSGTGVFSGVTGQINFKDDIEAGNYPYRGHLRF
jgi:hypothetical protein